MESGQVPATPVPPGRIFVGREHEFDELIAGHDSASSSRGSLYLVSGGPGAGKTRLIDEFTARAGELGSAVFWGRCWEVGGAPAYWPWVQILRGLLRGPDVDALIVQLGPGAAYVAQLVPEVAHRSADTPTIVSLDSDQARFALFDAVASLLRAAAAQRPLVIVLDDLHGGDVPSLLLLRFVAQEIRTAPIQVIGTYREVEAALSPETGPVISELARDSHVLALRGLSEADVQLFIERTWGEPRSELASAVHERTEGNPLFVSEILRLLTRENDGAAQRVHSQRFEVPASVRESIRRRVQLLPEDAREVLGVASVIGREFNLAVLGELTDVGTDALLDVLDEAIVAGLVGEVANAPSQYIFSHALVRETMYADIPSARRTKLHGTVAEVLERLHATDLEPREAEIAHHYFEALPSGNPQRAVDYATRAGRRCMKLLAYEKASSHFRQAIEV
ncbi:MAG: hypothetical protein QOG54_977, partial [Actinomycetota bacterium]|nr:hypothetical protein [Actinomycetota bacterium]